MHRRPSTWPALLRAQARLPLGLAAAYDGPVLGSIVRVLVGKVREDEATVGGVPASVFRPGRGEGPWPAVVLFPGITRRGRAHPGLRAIGRGLAASGRLAILAEPEGLATGELTPTSILQARAAVEAALARPDVAYHRAALVGVSGGGTLALLTAGDPTIGDHVAIVLALAPLNDVTEAIRVITTGVYRDGDVLVPFDSGDFFKLVIAKSVVACLPPGDERTALRSRLLSLDDYAPEPLTCLRGWPRDGLEAPARAVVELLSNDVPERFDGLYAALPDELRAGVDLLSPLTVATRITAPVELVVARADKYITLADALSFEATCPTARLTILESLTHVVPTISPTAARDLARFDAILVRLLAASYSRR